MPPTLVVKVGGSLFLEGEALRVVLGVVRDLARGRSLLVVPGGGPFADTVRVLDRNLTLSDTDAHWLAVGAMDLSASLVAGQLDGGRVVRWPGEISRALASGGIPVLAPHAWLRRSDPLPHSWDVTSDSIAAWVAARLGASDLVLVKRPGAGLCRSGQPGARWRRLVDPCFPHIVGTGMRWMVVGADRFGEAAAASDGTARF